MAEIFNSGANVLAYNKNGKKYGMTFAWGMMIDQDIVCCLLGTQSDSANNLTVGDIVGISALSTMQEKIAFHFGENHSLKQDKFQNIKYLEKSNGAIIIPDSKVMLVGKVIEINHVPKGNEDYLIVIKVLEKEENKNYKFFSYADY